MDQSFFCIRSKFQQSNNRKFASSSKGQKVLRIRNRCQASYGQKFSVSCCKLLYYLSYFISSFCHANVFTAVYVDRLISRVKIHHHRQRVKKRSSFLMNTRSEVRNAQECIHNEPQEEPIQTNTL